MTQPTHRPLLLALALTLAGCGGGGEDKTAACSPQDLEIARLKGRVAALEQENAELKTTAPGVLAEIRKALAAAKPDKAKAALATLQKHYPGSQEADFGAKEIAAYEAKAKADADKAEKRRLLGFKALGTSNVVETDQVKVNIESAALSKHWIFDRYDNQSFEREPSRGYTYALLTLSITTKNVSDPRLPVFAAYVPEGDSLKRVAMGSYEFARWSGYGYYLGNYADYKNDFDHANKIAFSYGIEIGNDNLKKPVFIVASPMGCAYRIYQSRGGPPVAYSYVEQDCPSLGDKLTQANFDNDRLVIVKVLGGGS